MHLVLLDTDQETPLHILRYESGVSLYLLMRDPVNHLYLLPGSKIKQNLGTAFPFVQVRTVTWDTLLKHRYDFYLYEYIQALQQFKEVIFF